MLEPVIVIDPEVMSGTPCFRGTRVPFKNLIDYLEDGHSLGEFLRQFPTVAHEMAVQALRGREAFAARPDRVKILLDECLPLDFRHSFPGHEAHSGEWPGLKGKQNGGLLQAAGTFRLRRGAHR